MASFTDSPSATRFTPYIQQVPVEALTRVGIEKQQRYDEGIQKIQSQIDSVAGMDVVRDIDKQYLQGQLDSLGTKLRTVAAGDFSSFQLVNSVGGMVGKIAKDPNVQNAVYSTMKYRKELEAMESARKEGKSSVANEDDFIQNAGKWISSSNLSEQFNARYTPYIDVKKKAMEAIKALHPQLQTADIPFEVKDGKINADLVADAMKRQKIEGIDPNQIAQAINASLTPDDINQLGIDSRYQLKGATPEILAQHAVSNYTVRKQEAEQSLLSLEKERSITTDPTSAGKLDERIKQYRELLGKDGMKGTLDRSLEKNIELVRNNPDAAKLSIYTDGFIKEFANAFSWKNVSEEFVTNPMRQQKNWVEEMKMKQKQFNQQVYEFDENFKLKNAELGLKAQEVALKNAELYGDSNQPWVPVGNPTDMEQQSVELVQNHQKKIEADIAGLTATLGSRYSPEQINMMIQDWKDSKGINPKKVPAVATGVIKALVKKQDYLEGLKEKQKQMKNDALDKIVKEELKNTPSLHLSYKGRQYNLSPRELMEIKMAIKTNKTFDPVINPALDPLSLSQFSSESSVDDNNLNENQKRFIKEAGRVMFGNRSEEENINEFMNTRNALFKVFDSFENPAKRADVLYRKNLGSLAQEFVPEMKALPTTKEGKITPLMAGRISAMITAREQGNYKADDDADNEKATEMLTDENLKNTKAFILRQGEDYTLQLKNEKIKGMQNFKVKKEDVSRFFGEGYVNNFADDVMRLRLGNGRTSLSDSPERDILQTKYGDFPNITKLKISAGVDQDLSNSDLFVPVINIMKKDGTWATFTLSGHNMEKRVGYIQGLTNIKSLSDQQLLTEIKKQYPSFDYSTLDY